MRNKLKLVVLFIFLVAGVFIVATDKTEATSTVQRGKFSGLASPRTLYMQNCARCHGSNGKAQTALGKKLEAADLTSADVQGMSSAKITRTIKNGRPGMPAFGKKLTPKQIASIAGYVRSL